MKKNILIRDKEHLKQLIEQCITKYGNTCDLNHLDVSNVTDMSYLFSHKYSNQFNGDISKWNTSNVKNMSNMFHSCAFSGDISQWNTSNVQKYKICI